MYQDSQVLNLNIDDILPNRFQPRIQFNEQAINELAESIKTHGVIQPIVVRKISDKYEIIAGERRYKASVLAGKSTIPAIVVSLDDKNSAEIALIENVQRQNLTPIEEAISYKKILDMGYLNQVTLAEKLGKTQSTIANKMRLLNLNEEVQEALMEGKISERHARSLLRLKNDLQVVMLNRIINERLTVRKTDEEIEKLLNDNNDESQKEKERENPMNNDILKEFNIPTEPIIEEFDEKLEQASNNIINNEFNTSINNNQETVINPIIETSINSENVTETINNLEEQPTNIVQDIIPAGPSIFSPISSEPISEETKVEINPGFMDVEKIETQAEEIYKEPEPVADIDMLLDTSNNPVVQEPLSPFQQPSPELIEEEEETVQSGGKFFTMFNLNEEESNPNFVSDIESKEVNMDFGEPTPSTSVFNFEPTSSVEPVVESQPVSMNNETPSVSDFGFNNVTVESTPIDKTPNIQTDIVTPTIEITPAVENTTDLEKTMEFPSPFNSYSLNDDSEFTNNISNLEEIPTIVSPTISETKVEEPKITYDDMGEIEVKLPETQPQLTAADFKTVINTIRECANTIEKFGFTIDTEEIDLEDSYEVIFKINKN